MLCLEHVCVRWCACVCVCCCVFVGACACAVGAAACVCARACARAYVCARVCAVARVARCVLPRTCVLLCVHLPAVVTQRLAGRPEVVVPHISRPDQRPDWRSPALAKGWEYAAVRRLYPAIGEACRRSRDLGLLLTVWPRGPTNCKQNSR